VFAAVPLVAGLGRAEPVVATWYGPGFEGTTTASGEPFNAQDYTAASRTLAFGTKLIVTYEGRSVVVRVNDRGPFSDADLDLSQAAAEYLGLTAVGVATVDVVQADPSTPTGPYTPQDGTQGGNGQTSDDQYDAPQGAQPQGAQPQGGETQYDEPQQAAGDAQAAQYGEPQALPADEDRGQGAGDDTAANGDQYGARTLADVGEDQYAEEDGGEPQEPEAPAVPAAPAPPAPAAAEVVVPQEISLQPTPEEVVPGSTVERRLQLAGAPAPAAPEAAPVAEETTQEETAAPPAAAPEPEATAEVEIPSQAPPAVEPAAEGPDREAKLPSQTLTVLPDTGGSEAALASGSQPPIFWTAGALLLPLAAAGLLVLRRGR
jgi:rare lipoprotein A